MLLCLIAKAIILARNQAAVNWRVRSLALHLTPRPRRFNTRVQTEQAGVVAGEKEWQRGFSGRQPGTRFVLFQCAAVVSTSTRLGSHRARFGLGDGFHGAEWGWFLKPPKRQRWSRSNIVCVSFEQRVPRLIFLEDQRLSLSSFPSS